MEYHNSIEDNDSIDNMRSHIFAIFIADFMKFTIDFRESPFK